MTKTCTEQRFLHDVREHKMVIARDDGVHRHIIFKRPSSGIMHFEMLTWPGKLCYSGDIGTFVFERLPDMFEFFRTDRIHRSPNEGTGLAINPGYWAEKLVSVCKREGGPSVFDEEAFRGHLKEAYDDWVNENKPEGNDTDPEVAAFKGQSERLWEALKEDVFTCCYDGEVRARDAATRFHHEETGFRITDVWEWRCQRYTYEYLWCCYALAWGVLQYDQEKAQIPSDQDTTMETAT